MNSSCFYSELLRDESGSAAIEYSLMAALIAGVVIGAVSLVGSNLKANFFDSVASNLT